MFRMCPLLATNLRGVPKTRPLTNLSGTKLGTPGSHHKIQVFSDPTLGKS